MKAAGEFTRPNRWPSLFSKFQKAVNNKSNIITLFLNIHSMYIERKLIMYCYYFLGMKANLNFGERLAELRKAKGFTQKDLAANIGSTQRMIAHYENHVKRPSLDKLEGLAKALGLTIDQFLGVQEIKKQPGAPVDAYLQRKLQLVTRLPKNDQKAIVTMIDALAQKKGAA